jgi:hypothetical protein
MMKKDMVVPALMAAVACVFLLFGLVLFSAASQGSCGRGWSADRQPGGLTVCYKDQGERRYPPPTR